MVIEVDSNRNRKWTKISSSTVHFNQHTTTRRQTRGRFHRLYTALQEATNRVHSFPTVPTTTTTRFATNRHPSSKQSHPASTPPGGHASPQLPFPAPPRLPGTHHVQHLLGPRIHLRHYFILQRNRHRSTLDVQLIDVKNMVKATVWQYKKTTLLVIGTQRLEFRHLLHFSVQIGLHW